MWSQPAVFGTGMRICGASGSIPGGVALIGDEGLILQILRIRVAQDDVGQAAVADEGGRGLVEAPDLVRDLDIRLERIRKRSVV
jgi:hypothetical protein